MKRFLLLATLALVAFQGFAFAQNSDFKLKRYYPVDFNAWTANSVGSIASGSKTVTVSAPTSRITATGGVQFNPFIVNATLLIDKGTTVEETVTITAATCTPPTSCNFTATFTYAHVGRFTIQSGTYGLQEAVSQAYNGGGEVMIEPNWPGTTTMIGAVINGSYNTLIIDHRQGAFTFYTYTGSAYASNYLDGLGSAGSELRIKTATVIVSGAAAATITATNFIPAGSIVFGVTGYVTSTFSNTSLTSMKIGDGTTTNKFSSATMALTAGTHSNSLTDGAAATAPLLYQAATSVVITGNGANFAANGAIRLVLFYATVTPPTQ